MAVRKRAREDSLSATIDDAKVDDEGVSPSPALSSTQDVGPSVSQMLASQNVSLRPSKFTQCEESRSGDHRVRATSIKCSLPPHKVLTFQSTAEYEVHYAQQHVNRCQQCHKNFPSDHYLQLHISENHDPIVQIRKSRGEKTFNCFVEGCDKVCAVPKKRRMHLTAKHGFPTTYNFSVINTGIDHSHTLLKEPSYSPRSHGIGTSRSDDLEKSTHPRPVYQDDHETTPDHRNEVTTITSALSSLMFIPKQVKSANQAKDSTNHERYDRS